MAVITELIDAGLRLQEQGNLKGAIEHFRQLLATYPGHARIMFELAGAWRAFGVPEQALPLYRDLLAMPKGQGLPPKDMPRLYTQLGATLRIIGEHDESLAIIEEGLRLHPSYRPLRAWHIFALYSAGSPLQALLDAMDLMLESLAPSRWDIFEDDIIAIVKEMRASLPSPDAGDVPADSDTSRDLPDQLPENTTGEQQTSANRAKPNQIPVTEKPDSADEIEVAVKVRKPKKKAGKRSKAKPKNPQMGKSAVRIDIRSAEDEKAKKPDDEEPPARAGSLKIPLDPD